MDAKYPANLDPKLREAYERVMGTATKPSVPKPASPSLHAPDNKPEIVQPVPTMVTEHVAEHAPKTSKVVHLDNGEENTSTTHTATSDQKKSSPVVTVILGIMGVLFFIGYAIFWAQIFGVNLLPF